MKIRIHIVIWIIFNVLLWTITFIMQGLDTSGLDGGNENKGSYIVELLASIFSTLITLGYQIEFLLVDRVQESLALEKHLGKLFKTLTKSNEIISELQKSIEHLTKIHENEVNIKKMPIYIKELFRTETHKSLSRLTDRLRNLHEGEISLDKIDCLNATIKCMKNAQKRVFAISYPDIFFWNEDGKEYYEANKYAILKNKIELVRFFIIRNHELDRKILIDEQLKKEFIEILKDHFSTNKHSTKNSGKMRIFLTDYRLLNFNQVGDNVNYVPDISLYDNKIVSEWIERAGVLGRENKIDVSIISFRRERVEFARKVENYLMAIAKTKTIEINSIETADNCINLLIDKLKIQGFMNN